MRQRPDRGLAQRQRRSRDRVPWLARARLGDRAQPRAATGGTPVPDSQGAALTTRRVTPVHGAVAGFAVFIAATLIAAAATPGYHPVRENISALASLQAPHAWIML